MAGKPKPHELRECAKHGGWPSGRSGRPRPILPERHLFVTEGTKTEPNYLEGLIELVGLRHGPAAKKQFIIKGEGDNTLNLLSKAETYLQNDANGFQHVWIIYDKDDFPADKFDNTVDRCKALNKRFVKESRDLIFHAIWSNECIELWFLLHFVYLDANVSRESYRSMLSEQLGKHYEKCDATLFDTLRPRLNIAIKNARTLHKKYKENSCSKMAPCTTVYELIEELRPYIK